MLQRPLNVSIVSCDPEDSSQIYGYCIAEYKNILSLIDFKTARKEKKEEWIHDYFLQATFYALSYLELTGIKIDQIVIIIAVDDGSPQVFVKNVKNNCILERSRQESIKPP